MTMMSVVGECFFWYRLTRVVPDNFNRAVKRLCVCVCVLPPSITIRGILPVQFTCLTVFFAQSLSKFSLVYVLAWHPPLHTPYISSPNHCLLFTPHAHTIATCFAVVPRLCHLILVFLNPLLGTLSFSLILHIHLTILISARWSATSFSWFFIHILNPVRHHMLCWVMYDNSCVSVVLICYRLTPFGRTH